MQEERAPTPSRVSHRLVSSQSSSQPQQPPTESSTGLGRSRTRHSSLRQLHHAAANALSRRLSSARFSLTRQRSVTSADGAGSGDVPEADAGSSGLAPTQQVSTLNDEAALPAAFSVGDRRRLSRSPQHQLSGPPGTSKFQLLAPMSPTSKLQTSLVHQRSNESHDSTTSGVSMISVHSSACSEQNYKVQNIDSDSKMDLMNFKKQDSFGCDEGGPDYGLHSIGVGAIGGSGGPGGAAGCGGASSGGSGICSGGACGSGADKQDDASIKGLWRRAFNVLKTKDKDKEKVKKKRGGKDDEDVADVDPVYSLLKRAADKGVQKCGGCAGPMTGTSPRASDASLFSASPVSLSSSWLPPPPPQLPPCNPSTCECLCHRVQLIPCITLNDLKPQSKHHHNHHHQFYHRVKLRSKSLSTDNDRVDESQQQQQQQQQQQKSARLQKQLSEDEELQAQQEPVWGGRGRISATFETRWSRTSQPHSLPE